MYHPKRSEGSFCGLRSLANARDDGHGPSLCRLLLLALGDVGHHHGDGGVGRVSEACAAYTTSQPSAVDGWTLTVNTLVTSVQKF